MPPETSSVTTHIHTDGPIPGPHSLLTVTAVAHTTDGDPIGSFTTNVRSSLFALVTSLSPLLRSAQSPQQLPSDRRRRPSSGPPRTARDARTPSASPPRCRARAPSTP